MAGNWLFFTDFFLVGEAEMRSYFQLLPWLFLFLAPAVAMRLWAEEKKSGTIEFLLTLPITDWQAVLGKFLGALAFLFVALLLSVTLPITVSLLGDMDPGPVIGGYLGSLFLGGSYLSIGLFVSSLTKNQIVAFVGGAALCFVFFIVGTNIVLAGISSSMAPAMQFLGLGYHFDDIAKGVIDSRDIVFYVSFIFFFLWLNVKVLERRRIGSI